tara:strand:- start:1987 stop:2694 length:708 start_codon:yes stop_codon:yes gene_type:complete
MIHLSTIKVNTIVYSYNNNFSQLLNNTFFKNKEINKFIYKTYNEYFFFNSLEIKKYFDEFFRFLKELINIESIHTNEIIVIKSFHELNTIQQNTLKSFFNKRVFILLTNKYSMIDRNILSYFVTIRIVHKCEKVNNLKEILFTKFLKSIVEKDIEKKKDVCYQLQQSGLDMGEFFRDICSHIICNLVITISVKCKIIRIFEEYERYYQKSYKDLIVLEGLLIKLSYELKDFIHCL